MHWVLKCNILFCNFSSSQYELDWWYACNDTICRNSLLRSVRPVFIMFHYILAVANVGTFRVRCSSTQKAGLLRTQNSNGNAQVSCYLTGHLCLSQLSGGDGYC